MEKGEPRFTGPNLVYAKKLKLTSRVSQNRLSGGKRGSHNRKTTTGREDLDKGHGGPGRGVWV